MDKNTFLRSWFMQDEYCTYYEYIDLRETFKAAVKAKVYWINTLKNSSTLQPSSPFIFEESKKFVLNFTTDLYQRLLGSLTAVVLI
jgi:hypothetical protein